MSARAPAPSGSNTLSGGRAMADAEHLRHGVGTARSRTGAGAYVLGVVGFRQRGRYPPGGRLVT
jgi:hypothetical protein